MKRDIKYGFQFTNSNDYLLSLSVGEKYTSPFDTYTGINLDIELPSESKCYSLKLTLDELEEFKDIIDEAIHFYKICNPIKESMNIKNRN